MKKIYIAGPSVFHANSTKIAKEMKKICNRFGFVGMYPMDNIAMTAEDIYLGNMELLLKADFVVADLSPFRGPSADAGTIFEIGVAKARNIPVYAYTTNFRMYENRVRIQSYSDERKCWIDSNENTVENFGLRDNLMIHFAVNWCNNFEDCVKRIKMGHKE